MSDDGGQFCPNQTALIGDLPETKSEPGESSSKGGILGMRQAGGDDTFRLQGHKSL